MPNIIDIPGIGPICVVDREQLRIKSSGRQMAIPTHLPAIASQIPTPPATFSWTKSGTLQFPILGNDRYGDCFYALCAHGSQCYTGNAGTECSFDVNALVRRYLQIAGGDNGLDDSRVRPEWEGGIVGPSGPRKVIDFLTIDPNDQATMDLCLWVFCGLGWTASLAQKWANNGRAGAIWDVGAGHSVGGHAMWLSGKNANGYEVQTWGIQSPYITVTRRGMLQYNPEIIVAPSMDMFNAAGIAPCGANYDQCAALAQQLGGKPWPTNPFPPSQPLDWFSI